MLPPGSPLAAWRVPYRPHGNLGVTMTQDFSLCSYSQIKLDSASLLQK